jgi:hypothetical protein
VVVCVFAFAVPRADDLVFGGDLGSGLRTVKEAQAGKAWADATKVGQADVGQLAIFCLILDELLRDSFNDSFYDAVDLLVKIFWPYYDELLVDDIGEFLDRGGRGDAMFVGRGGKTRDGSEDGEYENGDPIHAEEEPDRPTDD